MTRINRNWLTEVSHRAMACDFVVLLPDWQKQHLDGVVDALESIDAIEQRLTVYDEASEISRVNERASQSPQKVSASTFGLIRQAVALADRTDGAFDITAGPLVRLWGFLQRSGQKPTRDEIQQTLDRVGTDHLILDADRSAVSFAKLRMEINLGAIGKGFAIDHVAAKLVQRGVTDFLIHGGQSSVLARGNGQADREGWRVGIAHPTKPNRRLGGLWLHNQALATSGSGKQFFHHRGKRYGHILDPRTGQPAGDLLALTLLADSATDADALATGLFVLGQSEAIAKNQSWASPVAHDMSESSVRMRYPMLTMGAGKRQDEVVLGSFGDLDLDAASGT